MLHIHMYTHICIVLHDIDIFILLGGIIFLLLVYGITNSERYSVFHGI